MQASIVREEEVFECIKAALIEYGFDVEALTPEDHFSDDLGVDSIEMVDLVIHVERRLHVSLDDKQARRSVSIQDLIEHVLQSL